MNDTVGPSNDGTGPTDGIPATGPESIPDGGPSALAKPLDPDLPAPATSPDKRSDGGPVIGVAGAEASSGDTTLARLLEQKMDLLLSQVAARMDVLENFRTVLQKREETVRTLHTELQHYKQDLVQQLLKPIVLEIIQTIDDLERLAATFSDKEPTPEQHARLLDQFRQVAPRLGYILEGQGVEAFRTETDVFDPTRQTSLGLVPTPEPANEKRVAERVRPGYHWRDKVLRREGVRVYRIGIAGGSGRANENETTKETTS